MFVGERIPDQFVQYAADVLADQHAALKLVDRSALAFPISFQMKLRPASRNASSTLAVMRDVSPSYDIGLVKCAAQSLHHLVAFIGIDAERDVDREENGGIDWRFLSGARIRKVRVTRAPTE